MPTRFVFLLVLLSTAAALRAGSLESARHALDLVGTGRWARVVRIENDDPGRRYPAIVHGMVFELDDVLWLYTEYDGTQSLSRYRHQWEADRQNLAELLRLVAPGFRRPVVLPIEPRRDGAGGRSWLPNGCFVECVAWLQRRIALGDPVAAARLLAFYENGRNGPRGHTVLLFEDAGGEWVFDPAVDNRPRRSPVASGRDAMVTALAVASSRWQPQQARFLSLAAADLAVAPPGGPEPAPGAWPADRSRGAASY